MFSFSGPLPCYERYPHLKSSSHARQWRSSRWPRTSVRPAHGSSRGMGTRLWSVLDGRSVRECSSTFMETRARSTCPKPPQALSRRETGASAISQPRGDCHSTVALHQMSVGFPADGSRSSRMFGSGPQAAWRPRNARGAWRSGPAAVTRAPAWLVRRRALSFDQRSTVSEKHGVENTGPADLFVVDFRREFSTLLSIECGLAGRASTKDRFPTRSI